MFKEINHVAIKVRNMETSLKFYRDILGGKVIRDVTRSTDGGHIVYVQIAEEILELTSAEAGEKNFGIHHVALILEDGEDLDETCKTIRNMGYRFILGPQTAGSGNGKLAFFQDKSGALFELLQRKDENIRIPKLKNEHILEFDHTSILIPDDLYKECTEFYKNTLEFKIKRVFAKSGFIMSYYSVGTGTIETLYGEKRPTGTKPLLHIALRVNDVFDTKKYLESMGVSCPNAPRESTLRGFYILEIQGPDGEGIEFIDRESLNDFL